ncbi:hypothetical protein EfmAA242_03990 [Enterococcus faecium]|nr:hypothetical protein EfmAA242_03990 [Enterococcus faecium]
MNYLMDCFRYSTGDSPFNFSFILLLLYVFVEELDAMLPAMLGAAKEMGSPIIIQTSVDTAKYIGMHVLVNVMTAIAEEEMVDAVFGVTPLGMTSTISKKQSTADILLSCMMGPICLSKKIS